MSALAINKLIGRILTSDHARTWVLNGHRADVLSEFDLEPEEFSDIMAIRASTLQEFSAAVEVIYNRQKEAGDSSPSESPELSKDRAAQFSLSRLPLTHNV